MKKHRRQLFALLAVLAVCIGVYMGINAWNKNKEQNTSGEESGVIYVAQLEAPVKIAFGQGAERTGFVLVDGRWCYKEDSDFPLTQWYLTRIAGALKELRAVRSMEIAEDLKGYGLEPPLHTLYAEDEAGNALEIFIGVQNGDNVYAMKAGDDKIYTIGSTFAAYLRYELLDMIQMEDVPLFNEENLSTITLSSGERELIFSKRTLMYGEGFSWSVLEGEERILIDDFEIKEQDGETLTPKNYLNTVFVGIGGLGYDSCAAYKPDMEAYGLDMPELKITVEYTKDDVKETFTLTVGSMTQDNDGRYVLPEGSEQVYVTGAAGIKSLVNALNAMGH